MSRSKNTGKRAFRLVKTALHPKSIGMSDSAVLEAAKKAIHKRMTWGSTHRIRQRSRHLWSRILGRARRRIDEAVIDEQLEQSEV